MIKLEESFIRNGFRCTRIYREGDIALYDKKSVHPRSLLVELDPIVSYEVIKIQHQEATIITVGDKIFEVVEKEVYPKGTAWGANGFSHNNFKDAEDHYIQLTKRQKEEK